MSAGRPLLIALALALMAASAGADDEAARAVETRVRRAAERAAPGVVAVIVSQNPEHLPLPDGTPQPLKLGAFPPPNTPLRDPRLDLADPANAGDYTLGSAVVLDAAAGLVLTDYQLIDGARKVYVRSGKGGCYADIHAADARSNLAVLRLLNPPAGLVALPIARARTGPGPGGEPATLAPGSVVLTLGHPTPAAAGDGTPSVAWGALAGVRRRLPPLPGATTSDKNTPLAQLGVLLQFDGRTAPPRPGGAVLNLDGELVGLATPGAALTGADAGGGFAVPMDPHHRKIVDVLRAGREVEYGFLGVMLQSGRGAFRPGPGQAGDGLPLGSVTPGGPAFLAGLAGFGETILAIDGTRLQTPDDLFLAVGAALAGSRVEVVVQGPFGQPRRVTAVLAKHAHDLPKLASAPPPGGFGVRVDYASVLTNRTGLGAVPPGVAVVGFDPDAPAAAKFAALHKDPAGPPPNWVVLAVDGRPVRTPDEFAARCKDKASATLTVADSARPNDTHSLTLP